MEHRAVDDLEARMDLIRSAPPDVGVVELIVRRPAVGEREVLDIADLDPDEGVRGDTWRQRGSRHTPDGSAEPGRQVTVMNVRAIALFAGTPDRWPLAGDQLYLDLDISEDNLPPGSRLAIGEAVLEVSPEPHTGCAKFRDRFGAAASRIVNSPDGRRLRLRGMNARVVVPGAVRRGDAVRKVTAAETAELV